MKDLFYKIKSFTNSIMFRVIGSIIILILIVTLVIEMLSFLVFSRSIIRMYEKDGEQAAKEALTKINANNFDDYLNKDREDEYIDDYVNLALLGQKEETSRIYVIQFSDKKMKDATYIFDIHSDVAVKEYEVGDKKSISSGRFRRKLKTLYRGKRTRETYVKRNRTEKKNSYVTTLVPIKNSGGTIVGILGVQYSIEKLVVSGISFSTWASIISFFIIIFTSILVYRFFKRNVVSPIINIRDESKRFALENTIIKEKKLEESSKITEIRELAQAIDKMECDTIQYISNLTLITKEKERVGTELKLASAIQRGVLANDLPNSSEFNISAKMVSAKEIGGDFYDFYMIDENHLALVIADVAGKGIPAALFMMITKILLKTRMFTSKTPADVLARVNNEICKDNKTNMFVTVWLGVLELSTGNLMFANAGHEDIAVYKNKKNFILYKEEHGIVLGAFENYKYKNYNIKLNVGDKLFLYTDGVVEAMNKDDSMFGLDQMIESLNKSKNRDVEEILMNVENDVNQFVGGATQFDDLTMLAVEYRGGKTK